MSLAENICQNLDENISKNLSGKYSLKLLDPAKQYAKDAIRATSKKQFKKKQKQLMTFLVINLTTKLQEFTSE